jgi:hypothetical protein
MGLTDAVEKETQGQKKRKKKTFRKQEEEDFTSRGFGVWVARGAIDYLAIVFSQHCKGGMYPLYSHLTFPFSSCCATTTLLRSFCGLLT